MLNLLIAIMSDSYERVMEKNEVEARKLQAETIVLEEQLMSDVELNNPTWFPPFLQVLQICDTDWHDSRWAGLGGKIATEIDGLKDEVHRMDALQTDMAAKLDNMARQQTQVLATVSTICELLERDKRNHTARRVVEKMGVLARNRPTPRRGK